jgi:hypothetical protein
LIDWPRALARGRYTIKAVSAIEWHGIPIDIKLLAVLRAAWNDIKDDLIVEIDRNYEVFEGRVFKADRFDAWLGRNDIP